MQVQVTAVKGHSYGGRFRRIGDVYSLPRRDARVLQQMGRVRLGAPVAVAEEVPEVEAVQPVAAAPAHDPEFVAAVVEGKTPRRPGRPRKVRPQ